MGSRTRLLVFDPQMFGSLATRRLSDRAEDPKRRIIPEPTPAKDRMIYVWNPIVRVFNLNPSVRSHIAHLVEEPLTA